MGSPKYEAGRFGNEDQVFVTLSRGFWMGKYEVTQDEWQSVMKTNPSKSKGKALPVEQVSWDESMNFCAKLTKLDRDQGKLPDGWEYRLPTEAQWEYACRAGISSTAYGFGDDSEELDDYAWYVANSKRKTHEVGKKKPNRWGLHDMHGNVFEWCRDSYQDGLVGGTDPVITREFPRRVIRGGCWLADAKFCRAGFRNWLVHDIWLHDYGFRVALVQVSK